MEKCKVCCEIIRDNGAKFCTKCGSKITENPIIKIGDRVRILRNDKTDIILKANNESTLFHTLSGIYHKNDIEIIDKNTGAIFNFNLWKMLNLLDSIGFKDNVRFIVSKTSETKYKNKIGRVDHNKERIILEYAVEEFKEVELLDNPVTISNLEWLLSSATSVIILPARTKKEITDFIEFVLKSENTEYSDTNQYTYDYITTSKKFKSKLSNGQGKDKDRLFFTSKDINPVINILNTLSHEEKMNFLGIKHS